MESFKQANWRVQYGIIALVGSSIYALMVIQLTGMFSAWPPLQQFVFIAVPVYVVLATLFSRALGNGIKTMLGTMIALVIPEIITPPYLVGLDGTISPAMLGGASLEVAVATFLQGIGVHGLLLWILVYPVMFSTLVITAASLLSKKQFDGALG